MESSSLEEGVQEASDDDAYPYEEGDSDGYIPGGELLFIGRADYSIRALDSYGNERYECDASMGRREDDA